MLTAGAVTERRDGRERYYSLRRDGLRDIDRWLAELDAFWAGSLRPPGGAPGRARVITGDGGVVHEARFEHPIERVWNAIVSPDELAIWLMPNDFEPRRRASLLLLRRRTAERAHRRRGARARSARDRIRWRWMIDGAATTVTITVASGRHRDRAPPRARRSSARSPSKVRQWMGRQAARPVHRREHRHVKRPHNLQPGSVR